jgi:signal peptidase II
VNAAWARLSLVLGAGVMIDQLTKRWAELELPRRGVVQLARCCCDLRLAHNRGAFFSMGQHLPEAVRRAFFVCASLLAIAAMLRLFAKTSAAQRRLRWALSLLCSGAVGNLVDRVRGGEVTDFVHLHLGELFHWATFNFADLLIAFGLLLLLWDLVAPNRQSGQGSSPTAS